MGDIRITLIDNKDLKDKKACVLSKGFTLDDLKKIAAEKLECKATIFYSKDGKVIVSPSEIKDGDTLFASSGEPFHQDKDGSDGKYKQFKLCVMGPGAVGKSAITLRFIQNAFVTDYDPTIEDSYRKVITVDEHACLLEVLDTAGQEDFVALRSTWFTQSEGFIFVFSVGSRGSFENLSNFYEEFCKIREDNPPLIIVANKIDLPDRKVTSEEAKAVADKWNAQYFETSAKTGENVEQVFAAAARKLLAPKGGTVKPEPRRWKWCPIL
jgi:GTPase KRas protein